MSNFFLKYPTSSRLSPTSKANSMTPYKLPRFSVARSELSLFLEISLYVILPHTGNFHCYCSILTVKLSFILTKIKFLEGRTMPFHMLLPEYLVLPSIDKVHSKYLSDGVMNFLPFLMVDKNKFSQFLCEFHGLSKLCLFIYL